MTYRVAFLVPTRLRGNAVWTRQRPVFVTLDAGASGRVPTPARGNHKIRFFEKIGFLASVQKKIRFFEKIGFLASVSKKSDFLKKSDF
jgi:hypothetical protein